MGGVRAAAVDGVSGQRPDEYDFDPSGRSENGDYGLKEVLELGFTN